MKMREQKAENRGQICYNSIFDLRLSASQKIKWSNIELSSIPAVVVIFLTSFFLQSCEKEPKKNNQLPDAKTKKVWMVNEGLFNWGQATLSIYQPDSQKVFNDVYFNANGKNLGDVGQSILLRNGLAWLVVNNSAKIVALNTATFKEEKVVNLTGSSPRYIHFASDELAFVTELYAKRIWVVNPQTQQLLDTITTTGWTEKIVAHGTDLFITERTRLNDTYTANVLVVNTTSRKITATIPLPTEPNSMVKTGNDIFVLCSENSSLSKTASLVKINAATKTITITFEFQAGAKPGLLTLDEKNKRLLWRDKDVFSTSVDAPSVYASALISGSNRNIYSMCADPNNGEIYLSDALDYVQSSMVYRYTSNGDLLHNFKAGVITTDFAFE